MIYLNENEKKHIEKFIMIADDYKCKEMILKWDDGNKIVAIYKDFIDDKENMLLLWENGSSVLAKLDTCFEDENDYENEKHEEFWSFSFTAILIFKKPPVFISENNGFLINYHNFPKEILVDGVKIN